MISESLSDNIEQNTLMKAPEVLNNQESEHDKTLEVNNLQQKKLEQINHESDTSEKQSDKVKTINLQEKSIAPESVIRPLSSSMGPIELFNYFVSSTPRMIFVLYLLILFTW